MGLVEIGGIILSRAAQRVEISAENLANATTPGYKARSSFSTLIADDAAPSVVNAGSNPGGIDFTNGALQNTGNPLDLAISGSGFFAVRDADQTFYTRSGQFSRDAQGHMTTPAGLILQSVSGDMVLGAGDAKVLPDGTVTCDGEPAGRIAVMNFAEQKDLRRAGAGLFTAPAGAAKPASAEIRQGMLEASNVSTAVEMISIMSGLRSAGSGQRVVQLYDDLMGRAVTAFGQS
jgi:flagellar basal-body rod protein FlgG